MKQNSPSPAEFDRSTGSAMHLPGLGEASNLLPNRSRTFGERREATLLFADLRQFTELSAQLAHEAVYELLSQVMDCLTDAVVGEGGTVIDYFGDGLAAMWNAPADQADHAERACRAARNMIAAMPELAADWAGLLGASPLRIGVGLHTGPVQVGNAGSHHVKKYGPRGPAVHTASRVEAATKRVGVPLLITAATAARLGGRVATYRVCRAQLPGIEVAVDLFTVDASPPGSRQRAAMAAYTAALAAFEQGELDQAARLLQALPPCDEPPTTFLLRQIKRRLDERPGRRSGDRPDGHADGVIRLDVK